MMPTFVDRDDPGGFAHVPALDGVRGLAVTLTVGAHLWLTNEHPGSRVITVLTSIRMSMWLGVDLFLALSGFLITGILFDTVSQPGYLKTFYVRRVLRIFPVYYLAIAVLAVLAGAMGFSFRGFYWPLAGFLENTPVWIGRPVPAPLEALVGHLWSIALEEQFYLVWPMAILVVRDRRRLMWVAGVLSVVALGLRIALVMQHVSFEYTYKMLPCRMDGLLLGGLLALGLRGGGRAKVFELRPLRWLGRYSYGIYVWHILLGGLIIPPVREFAVGLGMGKGAQFLLGATAGTALSVLIGWVSYRAFEVHFLRLKRFVPYRRS